MKLGTKLREYRKEFNISQEELAFKIDTSRQTISSWENNKTYPGIKEIVLICDVFNISVEEFIKEDVLYMKEVLDNKSNKKIRRNKDREVMNRLVFFRFVSVFIGALIFYPLYQYYEKIYLLIPILLLMNGVLLTIPIEIYRKKYNLKTYESIVSFFDEKYNV